LPAPGKSVFLLEILSGLAIHKAQGDQLFVLMCFTWMPDQTRFNCTVCDAICTKFVIHLKAWIGLYCCRAVHNNPRLGGCLPVAWKSGSFNFLTADSRQMLVSGTTSNAFLLQPQGPLFKTNVTGWCSE
jgi:hypothetical protein